MTQAAQAPSVDAAAAGAGTTGPMRRPNFNYLLYGGIFIIVVLLSTSGVVLLK